jgi:hypothetical protein
VIEYRRPQFGRTRRQPSFGEEVTKIAILATAFVLYSLHTRREKGANLFFFGGLAMWVGIVVAMTMKRRMRTGNPSIQKMSSGWWASTALLFVATLAGFFTSLYTHRYTCPHGLRWANNQLVIAWSDNGGPCSNGPYQRVDRPWRITKHWYVYRPYGW